jgi:hypothetical protein
VCFHDREGRPHPLTKGEPIAGVLGSEWSYGCRQRRVIRLFVPPFDTRAVVRHGLSGRFTAGAGGVSESCEGLACVVAAGIGSCEVGWRM